MFADFTPINIKNHDSCDHSGILQKNPNGTLTKKPLEIRIFETTLTVFFFIIVGQPHSQDEEKKRLQNTREFQNLFIFFF